MTTTSARNITCTVDDGLAHVWLDRPDKLNGLTLAMLAELVATSRRLSRDRRCEADVGALDAGVRLHGLADVVGALRRDDDLDRAPRTGREVSLDGRLGVDGVGRREEGVLDAHALGLQGRGLLASPVGAG